MILFEVFICFETGKVVCDKDFCKFKFVHRSSNAFGFVAIKREGLDVATDDFACAPLRLIKRPNFKSAWNTDSVFENRIDLGENV